MNLASVFDRVAYKVLVDVDLPDRGSHQHEVNGVAELREFFGTAERVQGDIEWYYFSDDQDTRHETGQFTFYDSREHHPYRSEWRFYYSGDFLQYAESGDILILVRLVDQRVFGLVIQQRSAWLQAFSTLFGLDEGNLRPHKISRKVFSRIMARQLTDCPLSFFRQRVIEELGLGDLLPPQPTDEEIVTRKFGFRFPLTREMSEFARQQVEVDIEDPDSALLAWLRREEELFRALERVIVRKKLEEGFEDVDDFIRYSLSVQNRRKSRMGYAFQHHLAAVFVERHLKFDREAKTEGNRRPDFLFPGEQAYHAPEFPSKFLTMLGAKSTCKDRWRQVLDEAARIQKKHLCTLEMGISEAQTGQMRERQLYLVVPEEFQASYTRNQIRDLMTLSQFIELVTERQKYLDE